MSVFDSILDLVFPRKCIFCGKVIKRNDICNECREKLPYTKGDEITQKLPYVSACVSPLFYENEVREAFLRYKFSNEQAYAAKFGRFMADCVKNNLDYEGIDVISCVPLSKKRFRKRGYNQSRLLAKEISERLGIPEEELLRKIKDNPAQSKTKSSKERLINVAGVYSMQKGADVERKTVLLVDDIVTTGATIAECARILRRAGAERVFAVTYARRRD